MGEVGVGDIGVKEAGMNLASKEYTVRLRLKV